MDEVVILGGGYGGALAAARLAQRGVGVRLVEAGEGLVERIRLHQVAAGDDLAPVPYSRVFGRLPVEVVRARVTAIDRLARVVRTTEGDVPYATLVYALGSSIEDDAVPGAREHALTLRGTAGALEIRRRLAGAGRVTVVGGGLTSVELAAEIAERHPRVAVTLVSGGGVGPRLSTGAERYLRDALARLGVQVREQARVARVEAGGVVLETGELVQADLVLWCGGFRVPEIARRAGLDVTDSGRIVVDDFLRSSDPAIHAIGDAAAFRSLGMQCATALPMAAYVADLLAGATETPFGFAYAVTCISIGRADGLVQLKHPDDTPRERFISGRAGAWAKELVCRFALMSVRMERLGVRYRWPKTIAA